ncbi:MAG TPA: glycosyltransferase family 2 protein [Candidatus Deferrimicrobiaceae bacterium]|jgi:glycosyltransferase involved in cell wall biosynthesis
MTSGPARDPAGGRKPFSAVLIALNEAGRLAACLESLAFADEIVVVDSGSTDATSEIARAHGARVVQIPWRGFGPQKQAAVDAASHDFVLNVDCDERVTPTLAAEIRGLLDSAPSFAAWSVPRRTFLGEKEIRHCGWYPDRTVRFFDRRRARFSDDLVHERVIVEGATGALANPLIHKSFKGLADLLVKLNRYSDLSALQMHGRGRRCGFLDLLLRPPFAFFKTFVLRRGFLDGVEGFVVSCSTAMLSFAKYVKLRELSQREKP